MINIFRKVILSCSIIAIFATTVGWFNTSNHLANTQRQLEYQTEENSCLSHEVHILRQELCELENKYNVLKDETEMKTLIKSDFGREVFAYMKERLECPEANYALAVHESRNFSSPFYTVSNNMFCMGLNGRGFWDFKVYNGGDKDHKCGYKNWKSAIDDMAGWQAAHFRRGNLDTSSNEAYIKSLKSVGYATDQEHSKKVLSHFQQIFKFTQDG